MKKKELQKRIDRMWLQGEKMFNAGARLALTLTSTVEDRQAFINAAMEWTDMRDEMNGAK